MADWRTVLVRVARLVMPADYIGSFTLHKGHAGVAAIEERRTGRVLPDGTVELLDPVEFDVRQYEAAARAMLRGGGGGAKRP